MQYPHFFDTIEPMKLYDPLAKVLGAFEEGIVRFSYLDAVKLAGHSCPTVAGAYLMAQQGLQALYGDALPQRGDVEVSFCEKKEEGVTGVIANVISMITGASDEGGFKGLNQKFARRSLLHFGVAMEGIVRLTRLDTAQSVELFYDPSSVAASPLLQPLIQKVLQNAANAEEIQEFGMLWQERVAKILQRPKEVVRVKRG
ncbi:MAG: hypothetical protein PHS10_08440 [Thiovulaceae bacterium]|nr:hypothetical protein [Sulfurimonadaceae bacterium]